VRATAQRQIFELARDDWTTPPDLFAELDAEFHFTLDPCCSHENALTEKHYTIEEDGLKQSWAGERVFMNPPYGREVGKWVRKAFEEVYGRADSTFVVGLVPSRTDTAWWHDYIQDKAAVRFVRGRLKFGGKRMNPAPFPSAIVVWR
jgi:phage N-6-adenine-methyltransferase